MSKNLSALLTLVCAWALAGAQTIEINLDSLCRPAATELMRKIASVKSANTPYSINMTVNGDPATRMAFTWFNLPMITSQPISIIPSIIGKTY